MTGALRTLFLVARLPLPIRGGGDLRVLQNVRAACRVGPVAVFALRHESLSPPPHPRIARWETSADPSLTVAPLGPARLAWLADPKASPVDQLLSKVSADEVEALLEDFRPDVAVVEEVYLHRYIPMLRHLPLILDTSNVEADLHADIAAASERPHRAMLRRRFAERVARFEAEAIAAPDRIWACSEADAARLKDRYRPTSPVSIVPNGVDVDSYPEATGRADELIYTANFGWPPNDRAARLLIEEIMPMLPFRARLTLCGADPSTALREAAGADARVELTGQVPDVRPYLTRAGCAPIPLREGGGTRLKAVEAFAARLPVVSTAKGVEGLAVQADIHYLSAETPAEFAAAIAELDGDEGLRRRLMDAAGQLAADRYSWAAAGDVIADELRALAASPHQR